MGRSARPHFGKASRSLTRSLRVQPEAETELVTAVEWYESKRRGLGLELLVAVDRALEELLRTPGRHPIWRRGHRFRRRIVQRFPYVIFFTSTESRVEVVAFAHAKRRPGYWLARSGSRDQ
ncbi:MAG: type II toxin-antitoxin system RelE/ParE family toxin [Deltaproteobacteria bacterium]|nr:type II toxin-antitoxin system RelE/ParE family toxin [Deltaproteobacteria bacterium]